MALALLLHGQKSLFGFENGHMKQKALHKVYINSAKFWGIKIEIYLTTEVPMGINIDQPGVQRNRYQMTPSNGQFLPLHKQYTYFNIFLLWLSDMGNETLE